MDPRLLIQLREIVEAGSMRRAAERLNTTQPTLTRNMKILEDRVGAPVLRRLRHGIKPTRLGQRLVEQGQSIIAQCKLAESTARQWQMGLEEELVVGIGPMIAASIMPRFFSENLDLPYSVRSLVMPAERLVYRVDDGELDAAIGPVNLHRYYENLNFFELFSDQPVVFAGPENALSHAPQVDDISALNGQTWIEVGDQSDAVRDAMVEAGVTTWHAPFHFLGDASIALKIAADTSALVVLPRFQARLLPASETLVELQLPIVLPARSFALWTRDGDRDRPSFLEFERRLRETVKSLDAPTPLF